MKIRSCLQTDVAYQLRSRTIFKKNRPSTLKHVSFAHGTKIKHWTLSKAPNIKATSVEEVREVIEEVKQIKDLKESQIPFIDMNLLTGNLEKLRYKLRHIYGDSPDEVKREIQNYIRIYNQTIRKLITYSTTHD